MSGRGKGHGTGRPAFFRCSQCRRSHGTDEYFRRHEWTRPLGRIDRVTLTGRRRIINDGNASSGRSSNYRHEYTCNDCKHKGWSRHADLARLWERRFGEEREG